MENSIFEFYQQKKVGKNTHRPKREKAQGKKAKYWLMNSIAMNSEIYSLNTKSIHITIFKHFFQSLFHHFPFWSSVHLPRHDSNDAPHNQNRTIDRIWF